MEKEALLRRINTMNSEELILLSVVIDCVQSLIIPLNEIEVAEHSLDCILAHCIDTPL